MLQRVLWTALTVIVVLSCIYVRMLAGGWVLALFGLAYLGILGIHVWVHIRYTATLFMSRSSCLYPCASHLMLLMAFLCQLDFTDTPYAVMPIAELFALPAPPFSDNIIAIDLLLFLPTLILWFGLWRRATSGSGGAAPPSWS